MSKSREENNMKFLIIKTYAPEDVEFESDAIEVSLKSAESNSVIFSGDWYHDKIEYQLTGFFKCLKLLQVEYEIETVKVNSDEY
jgi:hypothetical protein